MIAELETTVKKKKTLRFLNEYVLYCIENLVIIYPKWHYLDRFIKYRTPFRPECAVR